MSPRFEWDQAGKCHQKSARRHLRLSRLAIAVLATFAVALTAARGFAADPPKLKLLFLGDRGHHNPAARFKQFQPVMAARGIDVTYTENMDDLNLRTLSAYDGLIVYANTDKIKPEQETALLDYVASGKGFIPLHCASFCFQNSDKYIALVGAQFKSHKTGVFRVENAGSNHPIMRGYAGFESWDETYVHAKHNEQDRTVLEFRAEGNNKEPWTWVRTQGKGRVFYTAWGHDERTWGNAGFQNLVERGIRWATGGDPAVVPQIPFVANTSPVTTASSNSAELARPSTLPAKAPEMNARRTDVKPFEFVDANIPFYSPNKSSGIAGEQMKKMQVALDPAESLKHLVTPKGIEPVLFCDEKDLGGKPVAMNWDQRGRLWVSVTIDYPNDLQPEGQGHDKIVICEDTDGDGRADKFTTFADKLSIPTSLICWRDGVIVYQAPHTLFLRSTKGNDVCDERKILFSGWGIGDTHAGPSNLRLGVDNWLYGIVGYSSFRGQIGGESFDFHQGLYRWQPDPLKFEFLRSSSNNSWGVGISEEGILFGSTANNNPSMYMPIPNRYYEAVRGWSGGVLPMISDTALMYPITDQVRQVDHHGKFTAGAGHALYTARTYPPEYWNRTAFVAEPTGHLLATFTLKADGADFHSHNSWNLAASDDQWSAPIMGEVGPDGNVWMIDWYAFIVQHNPTPHGWKTGKRGAYETELRDHTHGRIYRLVYTGNVQNKGLDPRHYHPDSLAGASTPELVQALKRDNMFWRLQAQRLLLDKSDVAAEPLLIKLVEDQSVDGIGLNPAAIHALWTLHGLKKIEGDGPTVKAVYAALKHPSAGVRRNAVQVLPKNETSIKEILAAHLLQDADAQVQLTALLALADMPVSAIAADAVSSALQDQKLTRDPLLVDAATSAAARHARLFLQTMASLKSDKAPSPPALQVVARVAEHLGRGGADDGLSTLLVSLGKSQPSVAEVILDGLARGWPRGKTAKLDEKSAAELVALLPRLSPAARVKLVSLGSRLGSTELQKHKSEIVSAFMAVVKDDKQNDLERAKSARELMTLAKTDEDIVQQLLEQISPQTSPELAAGLLDAVAVSETKGVGAQVVGALGTLTPSVRVAAIQVLLSKPDWSNALLDAAEKGKFKLAELSLDQREKLSAHPNKALADRAKKLLARGDALPDKNRQKVIDDLLPLAARDGNATTGKAVFTKNCAKCHTHSGEGGKIGPDLTGMAVHPKESLLVDIMDPSRSVEGNFRAYTATVNDGRVITGLLTAESKTSVDMIDAEGKKYSIQRSDFESFNSSTKSLMPEGFEKQLSADDVTNLLTFLTQRGKYFPLPLGKVATVVTTRGMFFGPESEIERLIFSDWSKKEFSGVPFWLVDPQGDRVKNAIVLNSPNSETVTKLPKSVTLPVNSPAKAIHLLSGVSGWGFPYSEKGSVSMIVRIHYADGKTEDHPLKNGVHFADYISRKDVPESQFAFALRGQQIRYLSVKPERGERIKDIEFIKGPDKTAPVVMAITVESP